MKRIIVAAFALIAILGDGELLSNEFKHGFKARHVEVQLVEHSEDFTDSKTLGFGDKGHVEVVELGANESHGSLTIPETSDWIFVGLRISKADGNTEIYFGIDDKFQYNFKSGLNVIHLVNKATIGDRSQPYGGSDEPNTVYQLKIHMLGIGAYRHTKNTFSMLYSQGSKYIINQNTVTAKTGVSFENPEIYDGLDTVTLNGTFISKSGIKPINYSYADKSYALDKTRLFEHDALEGKHVYGSYDGLMGMSDTKGKLIYDFDLKHKGTLSIRVKPLVSSTTDRTIIMNKKDGVDLFGAVLKTNNKLYMVLNGVSYPTNGITVPTSGWFTVALKWNETQYSVIANGVEIPTQTMATSLAGAQTIVGSNIDGQEPVKHLNGQLELLAYQDDVLDTERTGRLFQTNHMMSVKTHVDILGRSKKDVIDTGLVKLENTYSYKSPGTGKTSLQVESITKYDQSVVTYGYDALGNVTSMVTIDGTYEYQYDYLNRLVREYNPVDNKTLIMSYTGNNNILAKKYYAGNQPLNVSGTPQEAYEYSYDTAWKDKLISVVKKVNGTVADTESFAYNSNFMSNPSQIGSKTLTWEGKRLTHINSNIEYVYNEEGIRIRKTVNDIITKYELNGSNIVGEIVDGVLIARYHYNEKGLIVGFEYNQKQYYYIKDLLGIITEVVDENGNVMVSYKYDAWGKIIDKVVNNQTIDEVNHFVYKDYYLDNETQWYYLNHQYYNAINTKYISINSIADIVATKLRRSRKTSSISPSIFINKENDLSIDLRKNSLESEESPQEFDSPNDNSKNNEFGSSIFTNAYVAFSQTASVIAAVVEFVGATSQGPLNSLTTYTIRYNHIAGNINVTNVGTLGDKVASAFKKVSIGLLIVSSVLQVVDNFTNDDYSLAEKVFNSAFDVGITVGLYFATASLGGPAGLAVAAIAFVALEVFDIDTHVKNWFKKIFNW